MLVPANTFFATAAAAVHAGARLRFVDCDPQTMAVDLVDVGARRSNADTAAVIVVHIGGLISPAIAELARPVRRARRPPRRGRRPRARQRAREPLGRERSAIAAGFSFYPTKVIAGGEGGMIVTDDDAIADEARIYRDQGKGSFLANFHTRLGANWRMSEPHAAIVLVAARAGSTSSSPRARRSPSATTRRSTELGLEHA